MLPFFKKRQILSSSQQEQVLAAIQEAEKKTSGEIRLFIEEKNPLMDTLERAREIFFRLQMDKTRHRNAVLLYIAHKHRELALFGDEGIHQQLGSDYWKKEVEIMLTHFKQHQLFEGVIYCIHDVGKALQEKFPYVPGEDKNELPDDVIFG
jgi:hypothetical protein